MIVHAYYEEDSRVRRQAESLVARGRPVDVYALRRDGDAPSGELEGVRVVRLDVQRHQGAGIATYLREYLSFLVRAGWAVTRAHRRRRYAVAEVHTLPDFLVAAALPLRLAGVPVILDLHEAMPDFFRMRFPRLANPASYRLLLLAERCSIGLATTVMTVNDALADRLVARGVRRDRITVLLNSPSLRLFDPATHPARPFMADGTLRLVYAGAITPTYELEVVLEALAHLQRLRPQLPVAFAVYGRGDSAVALAARAAALGVADRVTFAGRIPLEAVPAAIAAADIGLAPTRRDPFTDASLSTKIFEYGAMARPVVASGLPMIGRTFAAGAVTTYAPGDPTDLARAILAFVDDPAMREGAVAATLARVRELSWERAEDTLVALVDRLAGTPATAAPLSSNA